MLTRILLPIVILMIAVAIFLGLKQTKSEKTVSEKPEKVWRVNTTAVDFQQISPEIMLYGRVETPNNATLKSALVADVISINALEGDRVDAGQTLVTLDDTDVQLLLEQRQAERAEIDALISSENQRFKRDQGLLIQERKLLQLVDKALDRAKKLEESRLTSRSNLDDALATKQRQLLTLKRLNYDIAEHPARIAQLKARHQRVEALIKQANINLNRTKIVAPFAGRVSQLNVAVGDRVRVGDNLLSLYDLNKLEVRAQLPSRYMGHIHMMMEKGTALAATAVLNGQTLSLNLDRLSGEIKLDSGGVDGLFGISGDNHAVTLGSFVEFNFKLAPQDNVMALPFNALYGLNRVYRVNDGYLQSVDVQRVGEYTNDNGVKQLLLRSNALQQGDELVSTQLPNAITGLRVEILNE